MEKFQLFFFPQKETIKCFRLGKVFISGRKGEKKKKAEGKKTHKAWGGDEVARPQQFFQFQCTPNSVLRRMHTGQDLWENCPATKEGELRLL